MIFFKLNTGNFIKDFLGRKFFKEIQYRWLFSLLKPVQTRMDEYDQWRKHQFYLINITGQVISLTGYLNDLFDPTQRRIYILNANDYYSGVWISLEQEIEPTLPVSLISEDQGIFLGMESEQDLGTDFIVYVPGDIYNQVLIPLIAAVHQFKLAGKTFSVEIII